MKNKKILIVIIPIVVILSMLFILFIVDYSRYLSGKKPVFVINVHKGFSKNTNYTEYSGLLYKVIKYESLYGRNDMEFVSLFSKPNIIELDKREYTFIKDYFENKETTEKEDSKCFSNIKIFGIEKNKKNYIKDVFAWVRVSCYYVMDREIVESNGYSIPYKITLNNKEDLKIENVSYPRDGSLYQKDMKKIFPLSIRIGFEELDYDSINNNLKKQVEDYFYPLKLNIY